MGKSEEPNPHTLLAGVRPEDVSSLARRKTDDVVGVRAAGGDEHFVSLIGEGLVVKLERDGVRVILWQAPLTQKDSGEQERVLSALLTNLGARLQVPETENEKEM